MARMQVVMILMIAVLVAVSVPATLAKEYVVGDGSGWTNNNFDYKAWADSKQFFVGDSLVFNYVQGNHNVMKVNQTDFQACTKPLQGSPPLTSGKDEVKLLTSGKKWYICGATGHCAAGQKLAITVNEGAAPPSGLSAPGYSAASGGIAGLGFSMTAAFGVVGLLLFST